MNSMTKLFSAEIHQSMADFVSFFFSKKKLVLRFSFVIILSIFGFFLGGGFENAIWHQWTAPICAFDYGNVTQRSTRWLMKCPSYLFDRRRCVAVAAVAAVAAAAAAVAAAGAEAGRRPARRGGKRWRWRHRRRRPLRRDRRGTGRTRRRPRQRQRPSSGARRPTPATTWTGARRRSPSAGGADWTLRSSCVRPRLEKKETKTALPTAINMKSLVIDFNPCSHGP